MLDKIVHKRNTATLEATRIAWEWAYMARAFWYIALALLAIGFSVGFAISYFLWPSNVGG